MTVKVVIAAALLCTCLSARASTIDFETGAPSSFNNTTPLMGQYQQTGVSFAGVLGRGGSILDESSNFGINAHSGRDFLAFNISFQTGLQELITFATGVNGVSIYAGGGEDGSYTLTAFSGSTNVGTQTISVLGGSYGFLSVNAANITSVRVSGSDNAFVLDDLSYNVAPEPSSLVLLSTGLLGVGAALRRRLS